MEVDGRAIQKAMIRATKPPRGAAVQGALVGAAVAVLALVLLAAVATDASGGEDVGLSLIHI